MTTIIATMPIDAADLISDQELPTCLIEHFAGRHR